MVWTQHLYCQSPGGIPVGELRSCKPHEKTKKKKKGEEKETNYDWPFKLEVTLYDNN